MAPPTFEEVLTLTREATGPERLTAIDQLGLSGDPRAVPHLAELLGSSETLIRRHAAWALRHLGSAPAARALLAALRDSDDWVRTLVTGALGKSRDEVNVPQLLSVLDDQSEGVREAAIGALRELCGPQAEALLEERLSFTPTSMRLGDPGALDFTFWSECPACSEQAGWTGEVGTGLAMECPSCRNRFWDCGGPAPAADATWRKVPPDVAVGRLRGALRNGPGKVRAWAIDALAQLGPRAYEALVEALQDQWAEVRGKTAFALGALGELRAAEPLRALQNDPDGCVRSVAKLARRRLESAPN
ncbi:MAG: HEAT repeat domain-containing protein [Myxococcales bacterium]|nr:HEAT repeat domain-containing protein [Myxococcales bacterium]